MLRKTTLCAAVVYADQDTPFREQSEAYFSLMKREGYVDVVEYYPVEKLNRKDLEKMEEEVDLYFFVVTTDLIASAFCNGAFFKQIKARHHVKQIRIIPILFRRTALYDTFFSRITSAPANGKPVENAYWASRDEALNEAFGEMRTICFEYRQMKDRKERDWDRVIKQADPAEYRQFLQRYPHSTYEKAAQVAIQELTEENLWEKAQRLNTVDAYYTYLKEGPIKKYRFEAAARIRALEKDTDRHWKEVQTKDHLVMYMDYYLQNPGGKHTKEAKKIIDERLANPLKDTKGQNFKTQKNSLEFNAYENLKPSEIFAMNTHVNYSHKVRARLNNLLNRRQGSLVFHAIVLFLIGIAEFWLFDRWYEPSVDQYGFTDLPNTRTLQLIFFIVLNIWLLFRAYLYFGHLQRDVNFLKKANYIMQSLGVLLKTSFIAKDNDSVETIVKFFTRIDRRTGEIEKKTILNYLLQSGQMEQQVLLEGS